MDENKNWVNWRRFDSQTEFEFIISRTGSSGGSSSASTLNYTFEKTGLYLLFGVGSVYSGIYNVTSDGPIKPLLSSSPYNIHVIYGSAGQSMSCTFALIYNGHIDLVYITSRYQNAEIINYNGHNNDGALCNIEMPQTMASEILVGGASSIQMNSLNLRYSTTVQDMYTDGKSFFCCTTARESGSGYVSVQPPSSQGSVALTARIQLT